MRIAICDDEIIQQDLLQNCIIEFDNNDEYNFEIYRYDSGESLITSYQAGDRFEIILLDIRLKKLNGIETAEIIRSYDNKVSIIIITFLIEYAVIGYSVKANDFILKPIDKNKFNLVFNRIIKEINNKYLYIIEKRDEKIILDLKEIYYIESFGRKIVVHTKNKSYECCNSISKEEKKLKSNGFIRTHRSYLVNMKKIYRIKNTEILLDNNTSIPLSQKKYKNIYDEFTLYSIGGLKWRKN